MRARSFAVVLGLAAAVPARSSAVECSPHMERVVTELEQVPAAVSACSKMWDDAQAVFQDRNTSAEQRLAAAKTTRDAFLGLQSISGEVVTGVNKVPGERTQAVNGSITEMQEYFD